MTPKTIVLIIIRLFIVYVSFEIVTNSGVLLLEIFRPDSDLRDLLHYQLVQSLLFLLIILLLYKYSSALAETIAVVAPTEKVEFKWSTIELLTVMIISISIFSIISAVPRIVNQLYGVITSLQNSVEEFRPLKERFNTFFIGIMATGLQIVVAIAFIIKAKSLAIFLLKFQSKQNAV